MNVKRVTVFSSALLMMGALAVVPLKRIQAADPFPQTLLVQVVGFQAAGSQALMLRGARGASITNATLQVGVPVLGSPVSTIPATGNFPGAHCRAEYRQDVMTVLAGTAAPATLTLNFYGTRCTPITATGSSAHYETGSYSLANTASIGNGTTAACWIASDPTFNENADGSVAVAMRGYLVLMAATTGDAP
jgi:hypothetical protein